jgi:hypothetical protein
VDHLAKAVAVCSQPQSLMSLFQQTLPPELFQEIIMRLPRAAQVTQFIEENFFLIVVLSFLVRNGCIIIPIRWWK